MTRLRWWLTGLFLASLALASPALAQQPGVSERGLDSLRAVRGLRIRVKTGDVPWLAGKLMSVNEQTLKIEGRPGISTNRLTAAQLSLGRRRFDGSAIGFPIGVVAGGLIGYAIGEEARPRREPNGPQRSVGIIIGAAVGGGLGAVVGALFAPERWRDIRLR